MRPALKVCGPMTPSSTAPSAATIAAAPKQSRDAGRRPPPGAPGGEARIIGFQIGAAQHAVARSVLMQQQHAAVPDRRLRALQGGEKGVDLGAPLVREGPRLGREESSSSRSTCVDRRGSAAIRHRRVGLASNTRLGSTISCCAAISWISRAPASAVLASTPKIAEAACDSATSILPLAQVMREEQRRDGIAGAVHHQLQPRRAQRKAARSRRRRRDRSHPPASPRRAAR